MQSAKEDILIVLCSSAAPAVRVPALNAKTICLASSHLATSNNGSCIMMSLSSFKSPALFDITGSVLVTVYEWTLCSLMFT